jgi:hypothetical protein
VRQSKDSLRTEIDQLRRQLRNNETVLAALAQPGQWEEVLNGLRSGQSVEAISEWLGGTLPSGGGAMPSLNRSAPAVRSSGGGGSTPIPSVGGPASTSSYTAAPPALRIETAVSLASAHPDSGLRQEVDQHNPWGGPYSAQSTQSDSQADAISWKSERRGPTSRVYTWVETVGGTSQAEPPMRYRRLEQVLAQDVPEVKIPMETWTSLTADISLVQHLLALYFCWEYPTFASLSKEHFIKDFQEGRQRYCSSILVNALMALGCRFSSQPNTRANPKDPYTSGDHFFKECRRLLYQEQCYQTLTTVQALGIMSIREASCGRDSESWFYAGQSIKLATEMGLHKIQDEGSDEDEIAVQSATFWGAFALDQ